jgi:cytidylate kinase
VGAGGEGIGWTLAQRLGFRYVDEQIIERVAQQAQVDPAQVAAVEHRQPLLKRLIDHLSMGAEMIGTVHMEGVTSEIFVPTPTTYASDPEHLRDLIRAAVREVAGMGKAVIVAHAASMALHDVSGILRVLITASPSVRAQRIARARDMQAADAAAEVASSDRDRRDYLQRFYKIKEEAPTHYDVVINTDVLTPARAVDMLTSATHRPG